MPSVLAQYLPALVFLGAGGILGLILTRVNRWLGPRRPNPVKQEPYESGIPSDVGRPGRFPAQYYLVAMLFIVFDIEVIMLYPVAVVLRDEPVALYALLFFLGVLLVAFVYEWRRGAIDWRD
jgi:NADH-quinone oxidoreductase subunit A